MTLELRDQVLALESIAEEKGMMEERSRVISILQKTIEGLSSETSTLDATLKVQVAYVLNQIVEKVRTRI